MYMTQEINTHVKLVNCVHVQCILNLIGDHDQGTLVC